MPGIYTRQQTFFSTNPSSGQYRVTGSSTASIRSSSGSRYSVRRSSGRSSTTSSQRSHNDWQDSVRSNLSIPRNSRTYNLLSTPRIMSFAEGNSSTAPVPFSSTRDNSNDWGYFVDCDDHVDELPPLLAPMVLEHHRGTNIIPEIPPDGFILEL